MQKPDSLIFDMDGTLWDAVDTYAESWNAIFRDRGINRTISREQQMGLVGLEGKKVIELVMPGVEEGEMEEIYVSISDKRRTMLAQNGGILYDGVLDGLKKLSEKYQLFILSNCARGVIRVFIDWAGIDTYITDEIAYGTNFMPKHHNIKLLMDKHGLNSPVYVGDTRGDGEQSRLAGVPFVFVSYGFGETDDHDLRFDDFNALTAHFLAL